MAKNFFMVWKLLFSSLWKEIGGSTLIWCSTKILGKILCERKIGSLKILIVISSLWAFKGSKQHLTPSLYFRLNICKFICKILSKNLQSRGTERTKGSVIFNNNIITNSFSYSNTTKVKMQYKIKGKVLECIFI